MSGIIGIVMVAPEFIVKFIVDIGCFSLVSRLNLSPQAEVFKASSSLTLDALTVLSPGCCVLLNLGLRVFIASFEILLLELVLRLRACLVLLNCLLLEGWTVLVEGCL